MIQFKTPVVIEPAVIGRFRIVRGPVEAVDALTHQWPRPLGEKHARALAACRAAALGSVKPHIARARLVAAAREARILVTPEESRRYTIGAVDLTARPYY